MVATVSPAGHGRSRLVPVTCYNHPGVGAAGCCANCGKEICAACTVHEGGRVVCRDCAEALRGQPAPEPQVVQPEQPGGSPVTVPAPATTSALVPAAPSPPPAVVDAGAGGPRPKESLLSAALSLILPGAGQAYNGQIAKGVILATIYVGSIVLIVGGAIATVLSVNYFGVPRATCCCCLPLFLLPLIVLIYAIYDAYDTAEKINDGEAVRDWL